jgi:hypothetical protein
VLASCNDSLVVAVGGSHGAEARQVIGDHLTAVHQVALVPVSNRLCAEAADGCDPGVNCIASLVQGDGRSDGILFSDPRPALPLASSPLR